MAVSKLSHVFVNLLIQMSSRLLRACDASTINREALLTKVVLMRLKSFVGSKATKAFDRYSTDVLPVLQAAAAGYDRPQPHLFTAFYFGANVSAEEANECMRKELDVVRLGFAVDHEIVELKHYTNSNQQTLAHAFFFRLRRAALVSLADAG